MNKVLKKILTNNEINLVNSGYEMQLKLINLLPEPKDDIERSFYQYQCQSSHYSLILRLLLNLSSGMCLFFYLFRKCSNEIEKKKLVNRKAIFLCEGFDLSYVPESLKQNFDEIVEQSYFCRRSVMREDKKYFVNMVLNKYWTHPFFCLKLFLRMTNYSNMINENNCIAVITHCEYSFTSSFLTSYCEKHHVEHINVMHGEKVFDITSSFFRFSKCFIWDAHYKQLFCDLRADPSQFIIEKPISQLSWDFQNIAKTVDYTYYLGGENQKRMKIIRNELLKLKARGFVIAVRPHPRYNSFNETFNVFLDFDVEDCQQVSIFDSLARTRNAISLKSTVLAQAQTNGIRIIIDDITNNKEYIQLKELRYFYVSYPHNKLSNEINKYSK